MENNSEKRILTHKLVRKDSNNSDEYLIRFITKDEAERYIPESKLHYTKPIDPHFIEKPVWTDFSHYAFSMIEHDEWERVMKSDAWAEISCNNLMCDAVSYYHISRMLDKDEIIIDIGCGYNAQSYFFKDFKRYIGVNPEPVDGRFKFDQFQAPGTEFYGMSGQEFIKNVFPTLGINPDEVFCMCAWVPNDEVKRMVAETFPHHYIYYPHRYHATIISIKKQ